MTVKERLHDLHVKEHVKDVLPNLHVRALLQSLHGKERLADLGSCSVVDMSGLNGTVSNPRFSLKLSEADDADIPGLTKVFPRAFHPISPFMAKAIPDTPLVQQWWSEVHATAIADQGVTLLKVVDPADNEIIAFARWRLPCKGPVKEGFGSGSWSLTPLTEDHGKKLCEPMIAVMAEERPKVMQARPHYCE